MNRKQRKDRQAPPENAYQYLSTHTVEDAVVHYDTGPAIILRWRRELNIGHQQTPADHITRTEYKFPGLIADLRKGMIYQKDLAIKYNLSSSAISAIKTRCCIVSRPPPPNPLFLLSQ